MSTFTCPVCNRRAHRRIARLSRVTFLALLFVFGEGRVHGQQAEQGAPDNGGLTVDCVSFEIWKPSGYVRIGGNNNISYEYLPRRLIGDITIERDGSRFLYRLGQDVQSLAMTGQYDAASQKRANMMEYWHGFNGDVYWDADFTDPMSTPDEEMNASGDDGRPGRVPRNAEDVAHLSPFMVHDGTAKALRLRMWEATRGEEFRFQTDPLVHALFDALAIEPYDWKALPGALDTHDCSTAMVNEWTLRFLDRQRIEFPREGLSVYKVTSPREDLLFYPVLIDQSDVPLVAMRVHWQPSSGISIIGGQIDVDFEIYRSSDAKRADAFFDPSQVEGPETEVIRK